MSFFHLIEGYFDFNPYNHNHSTCLLVNFIRSTSAYTSLHKTTSKSTKTSYLMLEPKLEVRFNTVHLITVHKMFFQSHSHESSAIILLVVSMYHITVEISV
jgi:hypothetical protein